MIVFIMKKYVLFFFVAMVMGLIAHAGQLDKIRETREVIIAHRDASIPFSYLDDKKIPVGYAVELCQKLVKAIEQELKIPNLTIKYLAVSSASRIPAIVEGKAAMECGSTTNNAERRKLVDYTIAHFISSSKFLVRSDSGIEKIEDLQGKTVVSTKGTTNIKKLEQLNTERLLKMKIMDAKDHAEAFSMLERKEVVAFAMDDVLLSGLRANSANPETFKVVGRPMTIEPYAIMLPKGDVQFKKIVDAEMRRIIQSGEIYTLYRKWFEQPIPPKNITMALPMPYLLRDSLKYPSDKVADIVD
jgi:glutamate/aspartate transport system substrate-binding protein